MGWDFEIISDLGSGINYHKKGLKRLLQSIIDGDGSTGGGARRPLLYWHGPQKRV